MAMKEVAGIVQGQHDQVLAAVRARHSELREAEVQIGKLSKRFEAAKGAAEMRRRELGLALVAARELWPSSRAMMGGARGPGGVTWLEWLEAEGIAESTADRYMKATGWTPSLTMVTEPDVQPRDTTMAGLRVVPPPIDAPDFDPVPQPQAALPRPGFVLRLGRWQHALAEAGMVDTLITDHPYGARTHESETTREDGYEVEGLAPEYNRWTAVDVMDFAQAWSPRVRGWMVALCSHDLIPAWEAAYEAVGRYGFAPVPCVINGMSVRLRGDGPSSCAIYAMVGRPRTADFARWGTLPGAYTGGRETGSEGGRGKPSWLMRALVRDYSRAGDLICDPLAGYGATLIAALDEGRRCIGAEFDHAAYDEAHRRATAPSAPKGGDASLPSP